MSVFEGAFPQWAYLIGYNTISALLWLGVFASTAVTTATAGGDQVYPALRLAVLSIQTLALLEIIHAITGMFMGLGTLEPHCALPAPPEPPNPQGSSLQHGATRGLTEILSYRPCPRSHDFCPGRWSSHCSLARCRALPSGGHCAPAFLRFDGTGLECRRFDSLFVFCDATGGWAPVSSTDMAPLQRLLCPVSDWYWF